MQQQRATRKGQPQRASIFDDEVKKRNVKRTSVLTSLRATQIVAQKPALPAELISLVIEYLQPPDQIRCAQVSRKLKEMVYDDTRWVRKLQAIGVWDEAEARQRQEDAMRRKHQSQKTNVEYNRGSMIPGEGPGTGADRAPSVTLFDVEAEPPRTNRNRAQSHRKRPSLLDGFDDLTLSSSAVSTLSGAAHADAMDVLKNAKSIRGEARQQYGKVHAALHPLYIDLTNSTSVEPIVFRLYSQPMQQARVLSNLEKFSRVDVERNKRDRLEKLQYMTDLFQNRITNQFRQAYNETDVQVMHDCAMVLAVLDGGRAAVDAFIESHPLNKGTMTLANAQDCIEGVAFGHVDLSPSQRFFQRLAVVFAEQSNLIDQIFPPNLDVLTPLLARIHSRVIRPFVNTIFDLTKSRGAETYLKSVPGVFEQCMRFSISLQPTKASPPGFQTTAQSILLASLSDHVTMYLDKECETFKRKASEEVSSWERDLTEQETRNETFFMSGLNRQAVKRDFLTSFRKVVMMPVHAVAAFPLPGAGRANNPAGTTAEAGISSKPHTPTLTSSPFAVQATSSTPPTEPPTTELAAKAALMTSRLENIKSLFSIEVALNLVHHAKASIERMASIARHGESEIHASAKAHCEIIFISLLDILGEQHVKPGFDKAVTHLGSYNPRELRQNGASISAESSTPEVDHGSVGVEPLVTFLELVNVGDLIQQMLDVFYVQELVGPGLTDRDDFLNPAAKEKKRFEQMLDERVAAGMSKGIDVLMDEVDWICATTQAASDFNPGADGEAGMTDVGPTGTAKKVVALVEGHTAMLVGATDKTMLDVYLQEIGLRFFGAICKHVKRQRISVDGAIKLISDINLYAALIASLKQKPLVPYFTSLRELSQIYLIDCTARPGDTKKVRGARAKELAVIIADNERYKGIFGAEEVLEFAERRADWYSVKADVEKGLYGLECLLM